MLTQYKRWCVDLLPVPMRQNPSINTKYLLDFEPVQWKCEEFNLKHPKGTNFNTEEVEAHHTFNQTPRKATAKREGQG